MSAHLGALTHTFGSSRIASSAYQKWPTWNSFILRYGSLEQPQQLTHSKFENRRRMFHPPNR